jgi:hypothetical protein
MSVRGIVAASVLFSLVAWAVVVLEVGRLL